MKNKWTKLLFLGCIVGSTLGFAQQEADAGCHWYTREAKCSADVCGSAGAGECIDCYDGDAAKAAEHNYNCFKAACANDCSVVDNCADLNPGACGS